MNYAIFLRPQRLAFIFLLTALTIFTSYGQEEASAKDTTVAIPDSLIYWKKGGKFNLTVQQVGLTNWAAGGESSIAIGGGVQGFINFEKDDIVWENTAQVGYGVIRNGGSSNRFEKTDDAVVLSSKYSQKFTEKVLMTGGVNFRTQMDKGFKLERIPNSSDTRRLLISDFLAPGYLQASLGLTFRDNKKGYTATLAPFTGRFTFVLNDSLSNAGSFGITPGDKIRSEAGISFRGGVQKDIMENVKFQTNFNLFSNYEKFPNTVVNVEAALNLKVNNFIQSNISTQLIYDDDVIITRSDGSRGRDLQIKNVINVGFILSF